jgi:hypothetical protein
LFIIFTTINLQGKGDSTVIIDPSNTGCTVIVTVDGKPIDMEFVVQHASNGLDRFSQFDGFIAGATHVSDDGNRIIQYLQWDSKEAHETCMNDPAWNEDDSSRRFIRIMQSGAIKVDVRTYNIAAISS